MMHHNDMWHVATLQQRDSHSYLQRIPLRGPCGHTACSEHCQSGTAQCQLRKEALTLELHRAQKKIKDLEKASQETDGENLISTWMKQKESMKKSFSVLYDKNDLDDWATSETDFVLGLFNDSAMPFELVSHNIKKMLSRDTSGASRQQPRSPCPQVMQ